MVDFAFRKMGEKGQMATQDMSDARRTFEQLGPWATPRPFFSDGLSRVNVSHRISSVYLDLFYAIETFVIMISNWKALRQIIDISYNIAKV